MKRRRLRRCGGGALLLLPASVSFALIDVLAPVVAPSEARPRCAWLIAEVRNRVPVPRLTVSSPNRGELRGWRTRLSKGLRLSLEIASARLGGAEFPGPWQKATAPLTAARGIPRSYALDKRPRAVAFQLLHREQQPFLMHPLIAGPG